MTARAWTIPAVETSARPRRCARPRPGLPGRALLLSLALAGAAPASAQDAAGALEPAAAAPGAAAEPSILARGRSFSWGVSLVMPMYLGDVRERSGRAIAYQAPGGGVEGHAGYELPGGIAIGLLAGVVVHTSGNSRALSTIRAAAEGRWTIDVGGPVAPLVGIAAGLLLAQLDAGSVATAYARVLGGVQVIFEHWLALEIAVSIEGALPIDAFADAIAWISPQIGIAFAE